MKRPVVPFFQAKDPVMAFDIDPLTKRPTFYIAWKTDRQVMLLKSRKWHRVECSVCGKRRRCSVKHHKDTGAPWVCIMVRAWANEHTCKESTDGNA